MSIITPGTTTMVDAATPVNLAITLAEALGVTLADDTAAEAAVRVRGALALIKTDLLKLLLPDGEADCLAFLSVLATRLDRTIAVIAPTDPEDPDPAPELAAGQLLETTAEVAANVWGLRPTVPDAFDTEANTTFGTDGSGQPVGRTREQQVAHLLNEAAENNMVLGTDGAGALIQRTKGEEFARRLGEAAENNMTLGTDGSGVEIQRTRAEQVTDLANAAAVVTVTGAGEQDITVTAATTAIRISPTGNMTIDDVIGMAYVGQTILVTLKQDTTNRTLALAGGTNCALAQAAAITMPLGSGAVAWATLVAKDNGAGTIVPTFFKLNHD